MGEYWLPFPRDSAFRAQPSSLLWHDERDEALIRAVLKDLLRQDGFSVLLARGAREAHLAAVDSHPDLILSDVVMPETDGLKFCRTLRSDARTARISIILISGSMISEKEHLSGLEFGADDYLVRPYPHSLLVAKIHAVLRRYEAPEVLSDVLKTAGITMDVAARSVEVSR